MTKADQDEKAVNVSLGMNVSLRTSVSVWAEEEDGSPSRLTLTK